MTAEEFKVPEGTGLPFSGVAGLLRHIAAIDNAVLPGKRVRFFIGGEAVGYVMPELAPVLSDFDVVRWTPRGLTLNAADAGQLPKIARQLAAAGFMRWRGEAFDVRARPNGPVLCTIDRGALPWFGVQAQGVHLDALVRRGDEVLLWVARRAASKSLDPGKLDHIVAGGIPAGLGPVETLVKEAAEEASMPPALASLAVPVGRIGYAMERPEGLRRDLLHCYEVEVPTDFVPVAMDGEVEGFELWPLPRVVAAVRETDGFKFNVNLVLMALFLRHGVLAGDEAEAVRAGLAGLVGR
jgi:hypothetical protein